MPAERSDKFGETLRRLGEILGTEKPLLFVVFFLTVVSVTWSCSGRACWVRRPTSSSGRDVRTGHRLRRTAPQAAHGRCWSTSASWVLSYTPSYLLAGVVQRSMYGLRESVERKLNHLPLSYIDRQPRGDLLSRVTNDIDNLAQSLQQTTSQILTSVLTLIGVTVMMFTISPLLAVIALVTVPISMRLMKDIGGKARPRFMAQWRYTGSLNAQAEEVFTGHAIVKSFGRQREAEARFRDDNDQLYEASFSAQFTASLIQPAMVFMGNLQFVLIAVVGGLRISSGSLTIGDMQAHDPVRPPVLAAAHASRLDGGDVPVGHRVARAGVRADRRRRAVARAGRHRRSDAGAGPHRVRRRPLLLRPRQAAHRRA